MYREFRIQTVINNRDEYSTRVQLLIHNGDLTPVLKQARSFARQHGITRIPSFTFEPIQHGYRGIYAHALTASKTGVIVTEVFA